MFNIDTMTVKQLRDYAREQGYKIPGMRVMVKAELYTRIMEIEAPAESQEEDANEQVESVNVQDVETSLDETTGEPAAGEAGAADSGHSPATNDPLTLVTTAPKAYDGFSVTELDANAGVDNRGIAFRKVTIEARDRDWYEVRVSSGLHAIATETEARRFPTIWRFITPAECQDTNAHAGTDTDASPPQATHRDAYEAYIATEPNANAHADDVDPCTYDPEEDNWKERQLSPTCTVNYNADGRITRSSDWFHVFRLGKQADSIVKGVPGEQNGVKFTAYYLVQ